MTWLFSKAMMEAYGNSLSSQEPVVEYSAVNCLDGERFAQLNAMPTPHKFWHKDKTMDVSNLSQFGQTLEVLTEASGTELLMSYLAVFRAKTSVAPAAALESREVNPGCGRKWPGLLAKFDLDSYSWKTAQCSLLEGSELYLETWPRWGSMLNGECWAREKPDSLISATESGSSLPTPSGVNAGRNHTMGRIDEWGGSSNPLRGTVIGSMSLPEFEELVMGWPVMWTAPMPFAMDKFRGWLQQHGDF
jgi:hypothetical protein